VPEPLWWLLGAVVAFYFGAREAHHLRDTAPPAPPALAEARGASPGPNPRPPQPNGAGRLA
jgi:hypothetical protein